MGPIAATGAPGRGMMARPLRSAWIAAARLATSPSRPI